MSDPLTKARGAFAQHDWSRGFELFRQADAAVRLSPEDLETMGEAAWWAARPEEAIEAWQRAYAAYLAAGKRARAGYVALSLAREYGVKLVDSVSASWFNRAKRLLEAEPEGLEHGYLYGRQSLEAMNAGRFDEAIGLAQRAIDLGIKASDANLQAIGTIYRGVALVEKGDVAEGLALIDAAALSAVNGELGLFATGVVYCNTISMCCEMADYRRAADWSDAARRWSKNHPSQPMIPGDCRVHQAEVLALRGAWAEAEESARRGAEELRAFNRLYHAGEALYQIGAIRLRMGDLAAAHDLFRQSSELGRDPQPGLSLLLAAEGKLDAARASITRAVEEETSGPLARARLLPTFVEIALASGNSDAARQAVEELESVATTYGAPTLLAHAHDARGSLQVAQGEFTAAARSLRRAVTHWQEVEAPYEAARSRTVLAKTIGAQGDHEGALMELEAARVAFERLGAVADLNKVEERLLNEAGGASVGAVRAVEALLFTDIVRSTNLIEAIGDDAWLDVLGWHDQTLRSLFSEYGGREVDHAGDGFFVVFEAPGAALGCAVAIQRTLAEHRRVHGFAPQVRIGVHATMASRSAGSYRGKGVHEAARIAAAAEGGEILASQRSLEGVQGPIAASNPRSIQLKGIAEPVEVASIEWRVK